MAPLGRATAILAGRRVTCYIRPMSAISRVNPLRRSRHNRMIAGVCGGLAEWLGWDPTLVRLLYVLVSILSAAFPGILVYVILWILMPQSE